MPPTLGRVKGFPGSFRGSAGSSRTWTSTFPKFRPASMPRNAAGRLLETLDSILPVANRTVRHPARHVAQEFVVVCGHDVVIDEAADSQAEL
jgi:hypothetical protein